MKSTIAVYLFIYLLNYRLAISFALGIKAICSKNNWVTKKIWYYSTSDPFEYSWQQLSTINLYMCMRCVQTCVAVALQYGAMIVVGPPWFMPFRRGTEMWRRIMDLDVWNLSQLHDCSHVFKGLQNEQLWILILLYSPLIYLERWHDEDFFILFYLCVLAANLLTYEVVSFKFVIFFIRLNRSECYLNCVCYVPLWPEDSFTRKQLDLCLYGAECWVRSN